MQDQWYPYCVKGADFKTMLWRADFFPEPRAATWLLQTSRRFYARPKCQGMREPPRANGSSCRTPISRSWATTRSRSAVLVPTSMRRGEILAWQWRDIDWFKKTLYIHKSIWHQRFGPVKAEESENLLPLDDAMLQDLQCRRETTTYAEEQDWVFASSRMRGKQPLWPEAVMRNHIRPAAKRAGILKPITRHCFRGSFLTLLIGNSKHCEDRSAHDAARKQWHHSAALYRVIDENSRQARSQVLRQMFSAQALATQVTGNA